MFTVDSLLDMAAKSEALVATWLDPIGRYEGLTRQQHVDRSRDALNAALYLTQSNLTEATSIGPFVADDRKTITRASLVTVKAGSKFLSSLPRGGMGCRLAEDITVRVLKVYPGCVIRLDDGSMVIVNVRILWKTDDAVFITDIDNVIV